MAAQQENKIQFLSSLKPIYSTLAVFGQTTVRIHKKGERWTVDVNKYLKCYNAIIIIVQILFIAPVYLHAKHLIENNAWDVLSIFLDVLRTCNGSLFSLCTSLVGGVCGLTCVEYVKEMYSLDSQMRDKLKITIEYKTMRCRVMVCQCTLLSVLIAFMTTDLYLYSNKFSGLESYVYWLSCLLRVLIQYVNILSAILHIYNLYIRIHESRKYVEKLISSNRNNNDNIDIKNDTANFLKRNGRVRKTSTLAVRNNEAQNTKTTVDNNLLIALSECYDMFYKLTLGLNKRYSLFFLMQTLMTFILCVIQFYYNYLYCSHNLKDKEDFQFTIAMTYFMIHFVGFVVIVMFSERITQEADFSILLNRLVPDRNNQVMNTTSTMMLVQRVHAPIQLTACHFFPMRRTTLHTLLGGALSYLTIIIQFEIFFRNNDK